MGSVGREEAMMRIGRGGCEGGKEVAEVGVG